MSVVLWDTTANRKKVFHAADVHVQHWNTTTAINVLLSVKQKLKTTPTITFALVVHMDLLAIVVISVTVAFMAIQRPVSVVNSVIATNLALNSDSAIMSPVSVRVGKACWAETVADANLVTSFRLWDALVRFVAAEV